MYLYPSFSDSKDIKNILIAENILTNCTLKNKNKNAVRVAYCPLYTAYNRQKSLAL